MEVQDAYQAYVNARRENDELDKIATVTLPQEDMAAVWQLCADAVDSAAEKLSSETKARWEAILRSLARGVHEAV